ncbi:hypothetical protein BJX99DRAFT_264423 [Aspergillus californicus]
MQQPTGPLQWPGNHPKEQHNTDDYLAKYPLHTANLPLAVAAPGAQPARTFPDHVYPTFAFDYDGTDNRNIWLDPPRGPQSQPTISNSSHSPSSSSNLHEQLLVSGYYLASPLEPPVQEPALLPNSPLASQVPSPAVQNSQDQNHGYQCKWLGCRSSTSFRRELDLIHHLKTIHISPKAYPCSEPNCSMGFGRKDHLKAHLNTHQQDRHRR